MGSLTQAQYDQMVSEGKTGTTNKWDGYFVTPPTTVPLDLREMLRKKYADLTQAELDKLHKVHFANDEEWALFQFYTAEQVEPMWGKLNDLCVHPGQGGAYFRFEISSTIPGKEILFDDMAVPHRVTFRYPANFIIHKIIGIA
ncbi:MAG: hypothetical protein HY801_06360 [Candidatus Lindowbacteria bacterium]|nr:hypothetical protein [Candidatus Lindowbacteria bacterium]